ncbi:hypothetical protein [Aquimarina sp. 2201CG5-10]|uniref:hypothetical protein n=1 Tax=Aquimarina callyspongiae TaxID=3098150 RepID=UPI002AB48FC6|nr:hypothetical protein [Aquimarina sp. 2201CG5-10]MDY8136449.1 hypothetical protein [Aquimarina sp. 2201CG5-10]
MKDNNIISFLTTKDPEITDEIIAYYKKNPKELDLITNKEVFHVKFVSFFFLLGMGLTVGSRVLTYFFSDSWGRFVNDVLLDVASELGIAIFGGAVTAYFLEILQKRQYKQNLRFRQKIKEALKYNSSESSVS